MNKRVEAKRTSKKAKIVKAAKKRGANEFGQRSQVTAPFKTVSTYKPSYTFPPEIKRRTVAEKPDWKEWKYTPQARVWQACALSLDIEPYSIKPNPISWQTGPYANQLFEDESFQSENEKKEFKSRQRILLNNLNSKENSLWFSPNPNRPNLGEVSLPEFAAWCSSVEWPIPEELAALAKKPDTATVVKSENIKASNARQSIRYDENRNFLKERIDEGLTNFEAIWSHMRTHAGEPTYLFKSVGNSSATKVNEETTYKTDLNRQYHVLLKKLKEIENP